MIQILLISALSTIYINYYNTFITGMHTFPLQRNETSTFDITQNLMMHLYTQIVEHYSSIFAEYFLKVYQ